MTAYSRRLLLTVALGLSLAACGQAFGKKAAGGPAMDDEMTLGNPKAKVTVVEYASASCPHCARWDVDVWPEFRKKYVDTNKIHYVFREFLTEPVPVAAAGFLIARCAGKDKYFSVLDGVFRSQQEIYAGGDARAVLLRVAQSAGLDEKQFDACTTDEKAITALNDRVAKNAKKDEVTGTPTFVVNGTKLDGEQTLKALDDAIAAAQAAK